MIKYIIIFIVLQLIILIPSFFWYKKIIVRLKIKKVKIASVIVTLILPIIYTSVFAIICYTIINPMIRSQKFEKKRWIENVNSRYKMINDLKNNNLLIGKTKNEVIEILGKDYKKNCWIKKTWCYPAYDPDNYAPLDHYEFIVFFNESGTVEKVAHKLI